MSKENFVILPNQIFDIKYFNKKYNYHIWEHPHYYKKYNYNKKKLIIHKSTQLYLYDLLKSKGYSVKYINLDDKFKLKKYKLYDPVDKIDLPNNFSLVETPNFLLTKEQYGLYRKKSDKFIFNNFYMFTKDLLNILPGVKSQDKFNRKTIPKDLDIPKVPKNTDGKKFIEQGIKFVNDKFPNNYGNCNNFFQPITHKDAKKFLKDFIKYKFKDFGEYQDGVLKENNTLFHSLLSSSINCGLINPTDIMKEIEKIKDTIPLNSYEGYVRQLFWREYQRYTYIYYNFQNKNYFGLNKNLTKDWYEGTLGIDPVDDSIKNAFDTAYLHHIERLMIIGNYMVLSEIKPMEGFKWFMEFAADSYEWVMHQNVLDMVFFVSGGATMRRPYMSSSNYVLKMSDYKKKEWTNKWNKKYDDFLKKYKEKLWKFRYFFRGLK